MDRNHGKLTEWIACRNLSPVVLTYTVYNTDQDGIIQRKNPIHGKESIEESRKENRTQEGGKKSCTEEGS